MAERRSDIRNLAEYAAARFALASLRWTPEPLGRRLAHVYARLLDRFIPRLRRVARENLQHAFPQTMALENDRTIDGVFASIGRILFTIARFPAISEENVRKYIRMQDVEHVHRGLQRGKGLLFATAHLGNWELSAFAFAWMEQALSIVVRPLDNPRIDRLITSYRESSGNRSINKRDYARGILQALARNEMVGILADQHVQDGLVVDFFGRPATTSPGMARIAARTGAAVVPGFALWSEKEQKFILRFYPEVPISGDVAIDSQRIQSAIESAIREYPDQWLWIHRRWKMPPSP